MVDSVREGGSSRREKEERKEREEREDEGKNIFGAFSGFETRIYIFREFLKRNFIFMYFRSYFQYLTNTM